MTVRVIPRLEDHLWYPILVKFDGYHHIIEMRGREVNEWNDRVNEQWRQDTQGHPRGWRI